MTESESDGNEPVWIEPSVSYPYIHEDTGETVVTFTMPFADLHMLFTVLNDHVFRLEFEQQLNEFIVEHFDDILDSMKEEGA